MLHEFLSVNSKELVRRCEAKVVLRDGNSYPTDAEFGISLLISQLVFTLKLIQSQPAASTPQDMPDRIGIAAAKHGNELLKRGYTVEQVVHDYGNLCQALTELAQDQGAAITVDEFHTFNRCLDIAMAEAVTEFGRQRDREKVDEGIRTTDERLGMLSHELRNMLGSAMLAFDAIKQGGMGVTGATGGILERSLAGLRSLVDGVLADVRLSVNTHPQREQLSISELVSDTRLTASIDARRRGLLLTVTVEHDLHVEVDRQMIESAIANLLQNAFKFTHAASTVALRAHGTSDVVVIEVEDRCGGLAPGLTEALFQPFVQRNDEDRSGLGLGLSISRRGVEANGGTLRVTNLPETGCIFTIELPRLPR